MIVGDYHSRGTVRERVCKDFARVDGAAVDQTYRNHPDVEDLVCAVDGGAEKMLLLPIRVVPDMWQQVGWRFDLRPLGFDTTPGELDGRQNQGGFGIAHAHKLRQVFGLYFETLLVHEASEFRGERHDIHRRRALAEENGEQFLVGQGCGAFTEKLLPRAVGFGNLVDSFAHNLMPRLTDDAGSRLQP